MSNLFRADERAILSVSEFNRLVRSRLESALPLLWITGEISNFTLAASGHAYFTLKDAGAQVRCVAFRSRLQSLSFRPANGERVEVHALPTLYEPRGDLQLTVETIRRAGQGDLYARFLALKARLQTEGLFDLSGRQKIPVFPRCLGIVTSPQAAALRDVLTTLRRRAPHVKTILYPTRVQGDGAAEEIAAAIGRAALRRECDTLLICRGGGSLEDLWAFNEEVVARAIHVCPLPVISGIGHETDFTIADFVADLRAPTPTASAELAAPDRAALLAAISALQRRLMRETRRCHENAAQRLDHLSRRLQHPAERLLQHRQDLLRLQQRLDDGLRLTVTQVWSRLGRLQQRLRQQRPAFSLERPVLTHLDYRLRRGIRQKLQNRRTRLEHIGGNLLHLNPLAVLERGYAIVSRAGNRSRDGAGSPGEIIVDGRQLDSGEAIRIRFAQNEVQAEVRGQVQAGDGDV